MEQSLVDMDHLLTSLIILIGLAPFDQVLKESEQNRFENTRSLLDDKTRELTALQKQLKQQIARLVSSSSLVQQVYF